MTKRKNGDRWGVMVINTVTGEHRPVDNPYWHYNVHPWEKSAKKEAEMRTKTAIEFNHPKRYEAVYAGNVNDEDGLRAGFYYF